MSCYSKKLTVSSLDLSPNRKSGKVEIHLEGNPVNRDLTSLANTIALGWPGGTYTVTCRPPSYSNVSVTNSPDTAL